ncbi:MAG: hypothetical protein OFPI_44780 [Osedax symbiont Rs2]|nr:MAG: hypothetical protein OFPI_44780 [Osedax symbiont Rs2]
MIFAIKEHLGRIIVLFNTPAESRITAKYSFGHDFAPFSDYYQ